MVQAEKSSRAKGEKKPPYELYLMRHGIAEELGGRSVSDDSKRALTLEGRLKTREIARGLDRAGAEFDWVVCSPLRRAIETAEIVAGEIVPEAPLQQFEALAPGMLTAQKLISFLAQHPECVRVLVVGHEPSLSELASELIGAGQTAHFGFKKGGCCLITFEEFPPKSAGLLNWWLTPRLMRKLGSH